MVEVKSDYEWDVLRDTMTETEHLNRNILAKCWIAFMMAGDEDPKELDEVYVTFNEMPITARTAIQMFEEAGIDPFLYSANPWLNREGVKP